MNSKPQLIRANSTIGEFRLNSTYTQAGVQCSVGQESGKFKVQFFVGRLVVKIPDCAYLQNVMPNAMTTLQTLKTTVQ